jgi:dienelactone hydrolase
LHAIEKENNSRYRVEVGSVILILAPDEVGIGTDKASWRATLIAPQRVNPQPAVPEVVEWGQHYCWVRLLEPDTDWPRIIEVLIDSLGTVAVQAHVQRLGKGDVAAPDLGWEIAGPALRSCDPHRFADGNPCALTTSDGAGVVDFPTAPFDRRGGVTIAPETGGARIRYLRCQAEKNVPFQESAWRRAAFVIGKPGHTPRNPLLEPALDVRVPSAAFDSAYGVGAAADLSRWPELDDLRAYTHEALADSRVVGDDFGNVTAFNPGQPAPAFGMNRLNHCPAIFEEAWRTGDRALRDLAAEWCGNIYDLSIWWADKDDGGGTRYNNVNAAGSKEHLDDSHYMWRSNSAVNFCTKGFDSFLHAYEETGDPRMLAALNAQVEYARRHVHTDQGECRNIGDAADFLNLYQRTGVTMYRDEALRLFRELRTKLSPGDLFSQGGELIVADGPFIDDDQHGYKSPFAKPYIIGYALAGLPGLLRESPDEPKLRDVVRAVADFLAGAQDPVGGWRYPHPKSTRMILDQAMEHAAQLARAAAALEACGEPVTGLLDAIERTLQARVGCFARSGRILSGLEGWESNPGNLKEGQTVYDLYKKPSDRDPSRDYTEGRIGAGGSCPEGLAYFPEVIDFYLAHRPAERLFHANAALRTVLSRAEDRRIKLTPQEKGSYLRMARPEDAEIGFTLWAPEWATFPSLTYGEQELGGMTLDWQCDDVTGAVWYTIDRKDAAFTACFVPHVDYVACTYTAWPKPHAEVPAQFGVGPCQQMKAGVFESDDADLMNRLWFLSDGRWVTVGSCANGNARNVQYVKGVDSPEQTGAMVEGGWKTIQSPRPDAPLLACVSRDGKWIAGTAAEFSTCICNNANASHRCMHSQGSMPLRRYGPTTLRVHSYLFEGSLDDLARRYRRDVERWNASPAAPDLGVGETQRYGVRADLPDFRDVQVRRLTFPLAWPGAGLPFAVWRAQVRKAYLDCLAPAPPQAPFAPRVLAVEDRGSYQARKIALNVSADSRIPAYLLVPKAPGPFPAMLALHDHGAHFSIGKEKVVRPFGESRERVKDAEKWVEQCYGGKFVGDELAARGYVVFAADALFWGDRGRFEGVQYEAQQALAANMYQLGLSWAGTILWDDLRGAEFVQGLPEVDPGRIGCVGLSMGSHRAWSLAAATDIITAGIAVCWMGDTPTLTSEGNNQTKGFSAFSMVHPNLRTVLDYPDVASIACPKPMLFYNGEKDALFPVEGVQACYAKLRRVWRDQGAEDKLETRLWPVPHEFNADMQAAAFAWLDRHLKPAASR